MRCCLYAPPTAERLISVGVVARGFLSVGVGAREGRSSPLSGVAGRAVPAREFGLCTAQEVRKRERICYKQCESIFLNKRINKIVVRIWRKIPERGDLLLWRLSPLADRGRLMLSLRDLARLPSKLPDPERLIPSDKPELVRLMLSATLVRLMRSPDPTRLIPSKGPDPARVRGPLSSMWPLELVLGTPLSAGGESLKRKD